VPVALKRILAPALTAAGLDRVARLGIQGPGSRGRHGAIRRRHRPQCMESLFRATPGPAETLKGSAAEALGCEHQLTTGGHDGVKHLGIPAQARARRRLLHFHSSRNSEVPRLQSRSPFFRAIWQARHECTGAESLQGRSNPPNLNPLAAPTGRFGCDMPNLLGIPKERAVRQRIPSPGYCCGTPTMRY